MIINHNMAAMNAQRFFNITGKYKKKNMEKLSSGYKVNRAADDAAGLSISEKMRCQIRGLNQSLENIEDGLNLLNTADGALEETHRMLNRIEELSVRAANDTNEEEDREALDNEVQELKEELGHIFKTTSFNGKKLWTVSYAPTISGMPDDMQMYQDPSHPSGFGGVLINEKRYSWDEIGVSFMEDGTTFTGGKYEVKNDSGNGEKIVIVTDKGKFPPNISRQYEWSTDGNYMYVNGLKAASFSEMGIEENADSNKTYEFDFHGMHIEFEIPAGHDIVDIKNGINGDNFMSKATWKSEYTSFVSDRTVDYLTYKDHIRISDTWKDNLKGGSEPFFKFQADDYGLTLMNSAGHSYTTKSWEELGIEDWGLHNEINSGKPIDPDKMYTYTDSLTGFTASFNLNDVAGKDDVINALNQSIVTAIVDAPIMTRVTSPADWLNVTCYTAMNYDLMIDSQKSFSNWNQGSFSTDFSVSYENGENVLTYNVKNNSGDIVGTAKGTIDSRTQVASGDTVTVDLTGNDGLTLRLFMKNKSNGMVSGSDIVNSLKNKQFKTTMYDSPEVVVRLNHSGQSWGEPFEGGVVVNSPDKEVYIQSGANKGEHHALNWKSLSLASIGMDSAHVNTRESASAALSSTQEAIKMISAERSNFGAQINRLRTTLNSNSLYLENLQESESRIRDTDMAREISDLAKQNILEQVAVSMMTQANQSKQGVLNLLQ